MINPRTVIHLALLAALAPTTALAADHDADAVGTPLDAPAHLQAPAEPASDDGPPLLFGGKTTLGGYVGLESSYSRMFGREGALVGLRAALVLNHRFSLGLAGYGWTNGPAGPPDAEGNARHIETGYGGVTLGYSVYVPDLPVYLTVGALVGGGAIGLGDAHAQDEHHSDTDEDVFVVVQPELTLHANLTDWMRVGLNAGYRLTTGVDRSGFDESDINGLVLGAQLQFGSF